ncbi:hypothetical protein GZ77_00650 [Endozoicomonas montiporae]|uniref:Uncharacterized protein n=2 Tax=Endozoicomonas montiporae TaxID=1027273 RepID=A0A081N9V8_9GAMM|nr:hypothetical protein [Endozoicomonas montiporae]AMO57106.1 autophagy protein 16-like [Endozoicomonas montiporae CL-33]KEQ15231.1 hypothetical protein GZ77_00650 [Endozoicomonas montiporae]
MNSVNPGGGVSSSNQVPANSQSGVAIPANQVSQGYSGASSVSSNSGGSSAPANVAGNLPEPEDTTVSIGDLTSQSISAEIDARLSNITNNLQIDASDVYLNDTDSLFLMIKSFVDELVAISSMQSIGQAFNNNQQAQSAKTDKAKEALAIQERIKLRQESIQNKNNQLKDYSSDLAQSLLSKTMKEAQLANLMQAQASVANLASIANPFGDITRLANELSLLDYQIANAGNGIAALQEGLKELQALNVVDRAVVMSFQRALDVVQEKLVNVGSLVSRVRQRFDNEALYTGEDKLGEAKEAAREVSQEAYREEMRKKAQNDLSKDIDKTTLRQEAQQLDKVQESALYESELTFLPPREAAVLKAVFGSIDFDKLQSALEDLQGKTWDELAAEPVPTDRPPFDEGLAIVLQSALKEPVDELSEEERTNPAASTFAGDNLSLEGAKNPLIYAGLWLQAQMEQGEATQEAKEDHLEEGLETVARTEQLKTQNVADALQDFASIPEETAKSLDEAKEAEASISRRNPV